MGKNCGIFTWALRFKNRLSYKITTLQASHYEIVFRNTSGFLEVHNEYRYNVLLNTDETIENNYSRPKMRKYFGVIRKLHLPDFAHF